MSPLENAKNVGKDAVFDDRAAPGAARRMVLDGLDPGLQNIADRWETLPEAVKKALVAIVDSAND